MNSLIFCASPRKNGNCASIAENAHTCIQSSRVLFLSDYPIAPCIDCAFCKKNESCALDTEKDKAQELFTLFKNVENILLITPIYFYHAPSQLKALIDRSQRFWYQQEKKEFQKYREEKKKKLFPLFVAGRKGEKLSQGLELSLKYFAPLIEAELAESLCLYELDEKDAFKNSLEAQARVKEFLEKNFSSYAELS